jgi:hypothetical protein
MMLKKTLVAVGIAALIALGSPLAASAAPPAPYPANITCRAAAATVRSGETTVINCSGLQPNITGVITVTGPGVTPDTLSSIVFAAPIGTSSVTKTTSPEGTVSVNFKGPITPGAYTVTLVAENGQEGEAVVEVVVPDAASGSEDGLPVTGGTVSPAAIWLGVGAVGLGGIAVAAAAARRRAQNRR